MFLRRSYKNDENKINKKEKKDTKLLSNKGFEPGKYGTEFIDKHYGS